MLLKRIEHTIQSLVFLQDQDWYEKRPGGSEISGEIEAPKAFTAKILQKTASGKVLNTLNGGGWGYYIAVVQSEITLNDL